MGEYDYGVTTPDSMSAAYNATASTGTGTGTETSNTIESYKSKSNTIPYEDMYKLLHGPAVVSASVDTAHKIIMEEIWQIFHPDYFTHFVFTRRKKGSVSYVQSGGVYYICIVDGVEVERYEKSQPNGKFQLKVTSTFSVILASSEPTLPWNLPPYNFKITNASQDEAASAFAPCENDPIFPSGSNIPRPLVNTAGCPLEASVTRGLCNMSFSYNTHLANYNPSNVWYWQGKTNMNSIVVCGITFPPRTLRVDSYGYEYMESELSYQDGTTVSTTLCKYFKCDVALQIDPYSFNRNYLNVGTSIVPNGGPEPIYVWTMKGSGVLQYGPRSSYPGSQNAIDAEPISDPMFLSLSGTAVAPIDGYGRQMQSYRRGCLLEPVNFNSLNLPISSPYVWGT